MTTQFPPFNDSSFSVFFHSIKIWANLYTRRITQHTFHWIQDNNLVLLLLFWCVKRKMEFSRYCHYDKIGIKKQLQVKGTFQKTWHCSFSLCATTDGGIEWIRCKVMCLRNFGLVGKITVLLLKYVIHRRLYKTAISILKCIGQCSV